MTGCGFSLKNQGLCPSHLDEVNMKPKKCRFLLTGVVISIFLSLILLYFIPKQGSTKSDVNFILIVIDALRVDHLSCYGYQRATSPRIDQLADQGTMFTQAVTAGGWTGESVFSILTGTSTFVHQNVEWNMQKKSFLKTLPQLLKQKEYKTALFSNHEPISTLDISEDFDKTYVISHEEIDSHQLTLNTIDWIKKNKNKSFFVYLHFLGGHAPYISPEPYRSKYVSDGFRERKEIPIDTRDTYNAEKGKMPKYLLESNIQDISFYIAHYDGAILYTDALIGLLVDKMKDWDLLEDTVIMITADHGEEFGEHEIYFTHAGCYENNIKVPLVVKFPEHFHPKKIISQQVSLMDIAPTILEIAGLEIPFYAQGKSLLPLFKKDKIMLHPYIVSSKFPQKSIRSEEWKLIYNGSTYELYDLTKDPQEHMNVINEEKKIYEKMIAVLELFERESFSPGKTKKKPLTEKHKEILRSLGYLK